MITRRGWMTLAGGCAAAGLYGQQQPAEPEMNYEPVAPAAPRALVAVRQGEERRRIVREALEGIDKQVRRGLKGKKYVIIKPNVVSAKVQLAATHADALRGILDYLDGRFKGPVMIAEASAANTREGYEAWQYSRLAGEYKRLKISLVDLNEEAEYRVFDLMSPDLHVQPVRLAARMLDPAAYQICAPVLKTHNTVITTQSVKNMVLGVPLRSKPGEKNWNDKRKFHGGVRQTHYNMFRTARKLRPYWGATVVDGFEGMEGNGPTGGTMVPSRVAFASTDYIAADRVGVELMGVNPKWVGYLNYCHQNGVGQYDLDKIDIDGPQLATAQRKYKMHQDIERELQWMGPLEAVPPKLG